jgi:hypothetical protein
MKAVIALIVIALLAGGGWWAWKHRSAAPAVPEGPPDALMTPGGVVLGPPQAQLPAEAVTALDQADKLWSAAGADPLSAANAPEIARACTKALRALYNQPGAAREREQELVRTRLTPLGNALFFSKQNWPADRLFGVHTVQKGDNPDAIARKYGMSRELLNRLRGKDVNDSNLRLGDSLKVLKLNQQPEGDKGFALHVDKRDFGLDLFIGGIFARRYLISHGAKESPTPTGRTHLVNRVWHPDWTHPVTKQVLKYGDPENILGPIWLPFDAKELGQAGIGIHGYTGPDAKMQALVSHGCIRLQNAEAEELFHILSHPDRSPCSAEIVE